MNFGKTIQELRRKKNVTQEDLAAQLGVTAAAVSKWENNYTLPDILMLCALADYFDVTTDELLSRNTRRKYAVIAADTLTLGEQIKLLAKRYGIETNLLCTDFAAGVEAANADARVSLLLVSCGDAQFTMEDMETREDLRTIVSLGKSQQEVLCGFEMMLRE